VCPPAVPCFRTSGRARAWRPLLRRAGRRVHENRDILEVHEKVSEKVSAQLYARAPRERWSSAIAALTATFRLSTPVAIGMRTMCREIERTDSDTPFDS
jgi:hypothetical protein